MFCLAYFPFDCLAYGEYSVRFYSYYILTTALKIRLPLWIFKLKYFMFALKLAESLFSTFFFSFRILAKWTKRDWVKEYSWNTTHNHSFCHIYPILLNVYTCSFSLSSVILFWTSLHKIFPFTLFSLLITNDNKLAKYRTVFNFLISTYCNWEVN